jgi:hypothetical protein
MTKELYKYPFNAKIKDEMKIFLSDKICEKVLQVNYKNGQIFCTIKDKITFEKKEILLSGAILFGVLFVIPNESKAVGVSPIPHSATEIHRSARQTVPQPVPIINQRLDKIRFVKPNESPLWIYIMDDQFLRTLKLKQIIRDIRGGTLIETAALLLVIIIMYQFMIVGDSFEMPIVHPNGAVHRPANGGIQQQINSPKHGGRITRVGMTESNQCPAHQSQIESFVTNDIVDLHKCYDEVNRRASKIGSTDFECSFERFQALAMENGALTPGSAREAITILQGEMLGFYTNAQRADYGNGIYGPDFTVIGQGEYQHITHVEIKNPVGSDIEKSSRLGYTDIVKQGNNIGDKLSIQQAKWSDPTFRASLNNINPNAVFPESPSNTLGLVDQFDVPISEKMIMQTAVENNCTNISSVIFINNETNI